MLLDRGADTNAKETRQGQTALMWAAAEGHTDAVRVMVAHGAEVRASSKGGYTPLLFAARTGDLELVRFFLTEGANVNEAAADGTTALAIATVRSHTRLAKFLLELGADPNKGPGFTPLHWAAGNWSNSDTAAEGTVRSDNTEWSPLEGLRGPAKREFVKLLLEHKADPNARARGNPPQYGSGPARGGMLAGATPFFIAARAGDADVMRLLVEAGADPRLPNNQKTTPLMVASGMGVRGYHPVRERDALEAVKVCLDFGNDVNAVDALGETALHGTAYRGLSGSDTIIQLLVEKGAKLNVKDKFGWTPLAIAEGIYFGGSDTRSDKAAELFRKLGAEPTGADVEREGNIAELKVRTARETGR
jgi:ankyrin repeat protein